MQIVIRTDASNMIGSGHVMRCFTLASRLQAAGAVITFICQPLPGNRIDAVEEQGFAVHITEEEKLPHKTDWLIVDHYGLGQAYETAMRRDARHILAIDDIGRAHDCDALLDPTALEGEVKYHGLVPATCELFLGADYALVKPEFYMVGEKPETPHLLVTFGGADPENMTEKVLRSLAKLPEIPPVDVVVGKAHPNPDAITTLCSEHGWNYHCNIAHMAELMHRATHAIAGGGTTLWELLAAKVNVLGIPIAENQQAILAALATQDHLAYAPEMRTNAGNLASVLPAFLHRAFTPLTPGKKIDEVVTLLTTKRG